jgi:hypothetical protein
MRTTSPGTTRAFAFAIVRSGLVWLVPAFESLPFGLTQSVLA